MSHKCPLCGSDVTYIGLNTVECVGISCSNNPTPAKGINWKELLRDQVEKETRRARARARARRNMHAGHLPPGFVPLSRVLRPSGKTDVMDLKVDSKAIKFLSMPVKSTP